MDHLQDYLQDLHTTLDQIPQPCIQNFIQILKEARLSDRQVFTMGNGGSAATASHFVADLSKNTRVDGLPHFRVFGLTDNVASITAYANDEGYENIFSQQLAGLVRKHDVVVAISASGNSMNVLKAIALANEVGAYTVGLTGFDGGKLARMVRLNIHVPSRRIEQVEDLHMMVEHMVVSALKEASQNRSSNVSIEPQKDAVREDRNQLSEQPAFLSVSQKLGAEALDFIQSSQAMIDDLPNYDTLQRVLQFTVDTARASSGSILLLGSDGNVTDGFLAYGGKVRASVPQQLIDFRREGLAGWVIEHDEGVVVSDTRSDPRWLVSQWDVAGSGPRSAVSVPLSTNNQVFGVLTLTRDNAETFTECDLSFLTTLGAFLSINMNNRKR
jgi:D-sedoheptulose 7-phosphate isomerase